MMSEEIIAGFIYKITIEVNILKANMFSSILKKLTKHGLSFLCFGFIIMSGFHQGLCLVVLQSRFNGEINVQKKRPVNLNLFSIQFPLPAITSILHRISGFALFIFVPFLLWMLHASLASAGDFEHLHDLLTSWPAKIVLLALFAGLFFHLFAGIRHLFMDVQIGETLKGANRGAAATIVLTVICTFLAGYWLW